MPAAFIVAALALTACSSGGVVTARAPASAGAGGAQQSAPSTAAPSTAGLLAARRAAGIADCPVSDPVVPARADGLPDVTLDCLGADSRVRLAGLRGTPMVINVWAQWCGPCRQEAPVLAALHERLRDRVRLLGIDHVDPRPELAIEFARQAHWPYAQVVDPDRAIGAPLKVVGPPVTLFVAADGRIIARHLGPFTSTEQALDLVHQHLGVAP